MSTRREFLTRAAVAAFIASNTAPLAEAAEAKAAAAGPAAAAKPAGGLKTYTVPHTDLVVSRLAYGNAMIGSDSSNPDFIADTVRVIQAAYEQGISFFDTADVYGHGKSEQALGQVLKGAPSLRHQLVIQSKCSMREGGVVDSSREHITSAVEGSLQRLGTDYLDILLLHWPDSLSEPAEVARAFDELHRAGKVRYFGVSNYSPYQIELLRKHVRQPLVANQIQLGLAHWYTEAGASKGAMTHGAEGVMTLDYCRLQDIQVQAYSPLKGANVGKPPNLLNPPADASPEVHKAVEALQTVASGHQTSPAAVMLAWLLHHPAGIVPIIGATKVEHVIDNCAADRIELSRAEWYSLLRAAAALEPHTGRGSCWFGTATSKACPRSASAGAGTSTSRTSVPARHGPPRRALRPGGIRSRSTRVRCGVACRPPPRSVPPAAVFRPRFSMISMMCTTATGSGTPMKRCTPGGQSFSSAGSPHRNSRDSRTASRCRISWLAWQMCCASSASTMPMTPSWSSGTVAVTGRCCCKRSTSPSPPTGDWRRTRARSVRSSCKGSPRRCCGSTRSIIRT